MSRKTVKDLLVVSDLDGTVVPSSGIINPSVLRDIKEYIKAGGNFTIASGRTHVSQKYFYDMLGVKMPVITNNGAAIYDYEKGEAVWSVFLPNDYGKLIKLFAQQVPELETEILNGDEIYLVEETKKGNGYLNFGGVKTETCSYDAVPRNTSKAIFYGESEYVKKLSEYASGIQFEGVRFVCSAPTCFEILPVNASKGYALKKYSELYGFTAENTAAIGDYSNDLEMIKFAGISAAPENALEEVKREADITVCSCEDGAVSKFLEYLVNEYGL